jgi:hypothetical protein
MSPAFSSIKQAAAFVLLLLFLLAAPWLAAQNWWPHRKPTYSTESVRWEKLPWLQKFVQETNDIDIAFVGSSHMLFGIDTPYVQQQMDEREGRKTVVRSICFRWSGFDFLYFITKDLLAHRRIKTLAFNDECAAADPEEFHALTPFWFRYENDAKLDGLPLKTPELIDIKRLKKQPARDLFGRLAFTVAIESDMKWEFEPVHSVWASRPARR